MGGLAAQTNVADLGDFLPLIAGRAAYKPTLLGSAGVCRRDIPGACHKHDLSTLFLREDHAGDDQQVSRNNAMKQLC